MVSVNGNYGMCDGEGRRRRRFLLLLLLFIFFVVVIQTGTCLSTFSFITYGPRVTATILTNNHAFIICLSSCNRVVVCMLASSIQSTYAKRWKIHFYSDFVFSVRFCSLISFTYQLIECETIWCIGNDGGDSSSSVC